MSSTTADETLECPTCGEVGFGNKAWLSRHHNNEHGETLQEYEQRTAGGVQCPSCDRADFENQRSMRIHHATIHNQKLRDTAVCEFCGETFEQDPGQETRFCSIECRSYWQTDGYSPGCRPSGDAGEVVCEYCGEKFEVKPHRADEARFCSQDCHYSWRSENSGGEGHPLFESSKVSCERCDEAFWEKPSESRRFCSKECRGEWWSEEFSGESHHLYDKVELECETCGGTYKEQKSREQRSKYCSKQCKNEGLSERMAGENSHRWTERIELECAICGDVFTVPTWQDDREYCSDECWQNETGESTPNWKGGPVELTCEWCGEEYQRPRYSAEEARFCSQQCQSEWWAEEGARNARPWYGEATKLYRPIRRRLSDERWREIVDEYRENECEKCGATGEMHLHHVIPILAGGVNEEWNLMTLCPGCHKEVETFTNDVVERILVPSEVSD